MLAALLMSAALTGCGGNVKFQDRPPALLNNEVEYSIISTVRSETDIFAQAKNINKSVPIYYFQNFGGGGAGLGLLLGPIGVAANYAMISSNTDNDAAALAGKISLSPTDITGAVLEDNNKFVQRTDSTTGFLMSPYLMIVKGDNDMLQFTTTLDVASGTWKGRYSYHLDFKRPLNAVAAGLDQTDLDLMKRSMEHGFKEALAMFESDISGTLAPVKDITFYSESVSPRFKMPVIAKLVEDVNNEVIVLGPGGSDQFNLILSSGYHKLRKNESEISNR
ncbi:MAG: hypothetical protein A3B66_02585 [Alphaproteobacteria bacterium RIFCSPHIGHO2_02_FULL_46_13]|nr:MAG: hypothetical protein A3B66_02585 [Alphaproteobacteria bacterium RIFCSPHIGHO2_02_FULL_46_13]